MAEGNPPAGALVVARRDGAPWREHDYRTGTAAPSARSLPRRASRTPSPYDLRHTDASLRLAELRLSLQEIAEEMGHSVQVLAETCAHVIAEPRGTGPIDPDALIEAARRHRHNAPGNREDTERVDAGSARPHDVQGKATPRPGGANAQKRPKNVSGRANSSKPTGGLEPPTPSLREPSAEDLESEGGANPR
jgi:hypothetical protein